MKPAYTDIISRLEIPKWYDQNGVPRYDCFNPSMLGVYYRSCVYMEIACQSCQRHFYVGMGSDNMDCYETDNWYYGDPPIHNCVGDTMTSDEIHFIERWKRINFEWIQI